MENHASATLGDPPFKGLVMTSEQPLLLNGVYPNFFSNEVNSVVFSIYFTLKFNFFTPSTVEYFSLGPTHLHPVTVIITNYNLQPQPTA